MGNLLSFHPEVAHALDSNIALVALESTVITHGLPYPSNLETAIMMEESVRSAGAIPATIAIINGKIIVGLSQDQLEYLATRPMETVRKCSRRDISLVITQKGDGATTVAGTMIIAAMAGIDIFATGGIGGVHRGHPFDVSADLAELARTPIAVISSGAKSILDLALTREVLETNGVPVIGFGTDKMPAFFSSNSGLGVDLRLDTPGEVADLVRAHRLVAMQSGILVTVPVPTNEALDSSQAEAAIKQATSEAENEGISGPATTPWLLRRTYTGAKSQSQYRFTA